MATVEEVAVPEKPIATIEKYFGRVNEDHSCGPKGQAPENLAALRYIALNLLKQAKNALGGNPAIRLCAGGKEEYLRKVLASSNFDAIALYVAAEYLGVIGYNKSLHTKVRVQPNKCLHMI
jgi:hypothetical protein